MKKDTTPGAGVASGLSERSGFKGGDEHVATNKPKSDIPKQPKKSEGKFKIC